MKNLFIVSTNPKAKLPSQRKIRDEYKRKGVHLKYIYQSDLDYMDYAIQFLLKSLGVTDEHLFVVKDNSVYQIVSPMWIALYKQLMLKATDNAIDTLNLARGFIELGMEATSWFKRISALLNISEDSFFFLNENSIYSFTGFSSVIERYHAKEKTLYIIATLVTS